MTNRGEVMADFRYRSSTLTIHPETDGCLVCDFIGGDRSTAAMMEVIRILDAKLHKTEHLVALLVEALPVTAATAVGEPNGQ